MTNTGMDRREFLRWLAGGTIGASLLQWGNVNAWAERKTTSSTKPAPSAPYAAGKPLVIRVRSGVISGLAGTNRRILREMITYGLCEMAGVTSLSVALNEFFSKKDVIGFKFNSSQARLLGTNTPLAEEILRLLVASGYDASRILFIEVQPNDDTLPKTAKVRFGWGKEIDFGSGKDQFAAVLDQVTALVNVGLLKANAVAEMSGCLKNMSYGLIKHPARYHANHCTPYIADIFNLPNVRGKVRFNILNALRILIRTDQPNIQNAVVDDNSLLFSRDVVAVDAAGYEILDDLRKKRGIKPLVEGEDFPRQLIVASQKGLGAYHPDQIQLKTIEIKE